MSRKSPYEPVQMKNYRRADNVPVQIIRSYKKHRRHLIRKTALSWKEIRSKIDEELCTRTSTQPSFMELHIARTVKKSHYNCLLA